MGRLSIKGYAAIFFCFMCVFGAAFVTCVLEGLSFLFVRPFSITRHRQVCIRVSYAFFLIATFLLETWSGVTFKAYGDRLPPGGSYLAVVNHLSDVDWLIGLAFVTKFGYPFPGNAKSIVKASLGRVPIFGSLLRFAEFLFLTRSWAADRDIFLSRLRALRKYSDTGSPLWFTLYPEGTRLTKEKVERSQQYAISHNCEPHEHVLFPRFKAFTSIVTTLRNEIDGVIDGTFMYEGDHPSIKSALAGRASTVVHADVKYYPMKEMPEGEEELEKWLLDRWNEKDKKIAAFKENVASLGTCDEGWFPMKETPSLYPLYLLTAASIFMSVGTMYLVSKIENGMYILTLFSCSAVLITGLFTAMNIRPSTKGSSNQKKDRKTYYAS